MNNKHLITAFAVALLLYAGWRSWDYMQGSLQGVGQTTAYLVALIFLFASEIGLLVWLHVAKPRATTDLQETVSTTMIFVNFVGSMVLGLADLLKHNTIYQVNVSFLDPVLLFAPWVLIASNVLAYLLYHMSDSDEQLARAERRLHHEEVKLEMEARTQAIQELQGNLKGLAGKLAPHYYGDLVSRVEGRTVARFARQAKSNQANQAGLPTMAINPSGNGKQPVTTYNQEIEAVNPTTKGVKQ